MDSLREIAAGVIALTIFGILLLEVRRKVREETRDNRPWWERD